MMKERIEKMVKTALGGINRLNWAKRAGRLAFTVHEHPSTEEIQVRFLAGKKIDATAFKKRQVKKNLAMAAKKHGLPLNQSDFSPAGQLSLWAARVPREKVVELMKEHAEWVELRKPHTWIWKIKLPTK